VYSESGKEGIDAGIDVLRSVSKVSASIQSLTGMHMKRLRVHKCPRNADRSAHMQEKRVDLPYFHYSFTYKFILYKPSRVKNGI
jgi:hypothetical protein